MDALEVVVSMADLITFMERTAARYEIKGDKAGPISCERSSENGGRWTESSKPYPPFEAAIW